MSPYLSLLSERLRAGVFPSSGRSGRIESSCTSSCFAISRCAIGKPSLVDCGLCPAFGSGGDIHTRLWARWRAYVPGRAVSVVRLYGVGALDTVLFGGWYGFRQSRRRGRAHFQSVFPSPHRATCLRGVVPVGLRDRTRPLGGHVGLLRGGSIHRDPTPSLLLGDGLPVRLCRWHVALRTQREIPGRPLRGPLPPPVTPLRFTVGIPRHGDPRACEDPLRAQSGNRLRRGLSLGRTRPSPTASGVT